MKKMHLSALLSVACSSVFAMDTNDTTTQRHNDTTIQLPSKKILNERLCKNGFDHFVEKTKIDQTLGGQEKYPLGVALAVECALYDYNEYLKQPMMAKMMQIRKPQLIETILADHPQAIENLKQQGVLQ